MKKLVGIIFLSLLGTSISFGQKMGNELIDSLTNALKRVEKDTQRVNALDRLSYIHAEMNPEQGIKYGNEAYALAKQLQWKKGMAKAKNSLGVNYLNIQDYEKCMEAFNEGLSLFKEIHDKSGTARLLGNLSNLIRNKGDFSKALEYNLAALKLYEELGDSSAIARITGNIGVIYAMMGNHDSLAEANFSKAYQIDKLIQDKPGIGRELGHLANINFNKGNYKKSIELNQEALGIWSSLNSINNIALATGNMANAYLYLKDYTNAILYQYKCIPLLTMLNDKEGLSRTSSNLGAVYLEIGKHQERPGIPDSLKNREYVFNRARTLLLQALSISEETKNLDNRKTAYRTLFEFYREIQDYKNALDYFQKWTDVNDTINSIESQKKIANLEAKRENEIKGKEIKIQKLELLKAKNQQYLLFGGIGIMSMFAFIAYRNFRRKQRDNAIITMEKKRSDELLLNILPEEVAAELKEKGEAEARQMDEVTVLFTDFKGFTQLSERLTAKELVKEINSYFSAFDHIMEKYGIEKIKTIGDAYMAAGGLPVPNKTHAEDVVKAACEIQQFMIQHKKEREENGKLFFEIRIGIHTGPVVAGIVGVKKFAYDIWGDTVNTASRMESSGEAGKINISATTYELVKDKFSCIYRGKISAKGKGEIDMYFVENKFA